MQYCTVSDMWNGIASSVVCIVKCTTAYTVLLKGNVAPFARFHLDNRTTQSSFEYCCTCKTLETEL